MPQKKTSDTETNEIAEMGASTATVEPEHKHDHGHDHDHEEEFEFVEDPVYDVDYKGECAYEVKVTVPPANKAKQADSMYEEIKNEAQVPGFRKGRAPRKLIERKFAKHVKSEVEARLVSAAFRKLIKDKDLRPIRLPDIDGLDDKTERAESDPLEFTLKFEVAPRVELGRYRGIEVERPVVSVDDTDVKEALDDLRMRYATFETCEGKAKDGDQVIIDFVGTVDGVQFPGGSAENYPYVLGTKRFFPEFETALKGAKAGDEKTCKVTLPEDSPNEALRGKTAEFVITVNEVKRREMPKLDADFAKLVGAESVAALKERLKKQLQDNSAQHSDRIVRARALDKVIETSTYEIPKSLIEDVARGIFEDRVRDLIQARVPVDQITAQTEALRAQSNDQAVLEIKRMVTLNEIGEAEGIEVTDEDFESMAEDIATRTGLRTDVVSQYMAEEGRRRNMYEDRIFREKAIRVVMSNATITDKEVPREELDAAAQEQGDE